MTTHHPTIGDAVVSEFVLASVYVLLITLGIRQPETLMGEFVQAWINFADPVVQIVFALVPTPENLSHGTLIEAIDTYRHILAACLLISCGCFVYSRRHWCDWGERFRDTLSVRTRRPGSRRRVAIFGYRRMLLGVLAITFLMLFGESHVPDLASYLFTESWTYTRAPLLTTIAFAFACHAAALRYSLIKPL